MDRFLRLAPALAVLVAAALGLAPAPANAQANGKTPVFGTPLADRIILNRSLRQHHIYAAAGDDFILGAQRGDQIEGGPGSDKLVAGRGNDVLLGDGFFTLRPNVTRWPVSPDLVHGGDGNDILIGDGALCRPDATIADPCIAAIKAPDTFRFFAGDGVDLIRDLDSSDTILFAQPKRAVMFAFYGSDRDGRGRIRQTGIVLSMERTAIKVYDGVNKPFIWRTIAGVPFISLPVFETDDGYRDRFLATGDSFAAEFGDAATIHRIGLRQLGTVVDYDLAAGDDIDFRVLTANGSRVLLQQAEGAVLARVVRRRGDAVTLFNLPPVTFRGAEIGRMNFHNIAVTTEVLLDLSSMR